MSYMTTTTTTTTTTGQCQAGLACLVARQLVFGTMLTWGLHCLLSRAEFPAPCAAGSRLRRFVQGGRFLHRCVRGSKKRAPCVDKGDSAATCGTSVHSVCATDHIVTVQPCNGNTGSAYPAANHLHERRALYGESDDIIASAREYEERSHQIQLRQRPARLGSTPSEEGV
jgi:hypothetical protein